MQDLPVSVASEIASIVRSGEIPWSLLRRVAKPVSIASSGSGPLASRGSRHNRPPPLTIR